MLVPSGHPRDKKPRCRQAGPGPHTPHGEGQVLPMRLLEMFTISPEILEGSLFLGASKVLRENFSDSGRMPVWESLLLASSFWSAGSSSSLVLAIWYTMLGCSG